MNLGNSHQGHIKIEAESPFLRFNLIVSLTLDTPEEFVQLRWGSNTTKVINSDRYTYESVFSIIDHDLDELTGVILSDLVVRWIEL